MGRPTPESLTTAQQRVQWAFTEAPQRWVPAWAHRRIFLFDHGRTLRKTVEGLLSDVEHVSSPHVRRDVAATTVELLAIENVRRRGVEEEKVEKLEEGLRKSQINAVERHLRRRGVPRKNEVVLPLADIEWKVASELAHTLAGYDTTQQQISIFREALIDATALEVHAYSKK